MMGHREKMVSGDEFDAFSRKARAVLSFRPGERKAIKRKFWKRQRADSNLRVRNDHEV
jgi:hypothetical protein